MRSILKDWLQSLPFKMQAMALCALRGCDGTAKNDPHKPIVRYLRTFLLHPADPHWRLRNPRTTFFGDQPTKEELSLFWSSIDQYPTHFFIHLLHAAELLGYKYPEKEQGFWYALYLKGCHKMHANPETLSQFEERLSDSPHKADE